MTIELYTAPEAQESPISNTTGELPEQEPDLDLGDLLGSFDSQEEALAFINDQGIGENQQITDSQISPYNDYTHVERLTVTIRNEDQSTQQKSYYLVTDEGY